MKYIAAVRFADLEDGRHIYEPGEEFPRLGLSVSDERFKKLAGRDNLAGQPLIRAVEDTQEEPKKEPPKPRRKRTVKARDLE